MSFSGTLSAPCSAQRVMTFGYDQSGNIVHRQFQTLENYLSSSTSKYTAKLYSSPTTGYVRIIVSDENGIVGLPCGVRVYRLGNITEGVVDLRFDNGEDPCFDISNYPDGIYIVEIAVDINSRDFGNYSYNKLPKIKIIKQSK